MYHMFVDPLMRILPNIHSDNDSMLVVYMTESLRMSDMNFLRHERNPYSAWIDYPHTVRTQIYLIAVDP